MDQALARLSLQHRLRVSPLPRLLGGIVLFAAVYGITAKLGLAYSSIAPNVTLIWPPSGINLFVVLRFGFRLWPGMVLGDLIASTGTGARSTA